MLAAGDQLFTMVTTPRDALEAVRKRMQWKLDRVLRRWALVRDKRLAEWARR